MPNPQAQAVYLPPDAAARARKEQAKLYGPGAVAAGVTLYGFAEDKGWAKWVGGAALAFLSFRWWQKREELAKLQPKTVLGVLTQANKDALAQGLQGVQKQQFLYKRVADCFGEAEARQYVKVSAPAPADDPTGPPPTGMNGL